MTTATITKPAGKAVVKLIDGNWVGFRPDGSKVGKGSYDQTRVVMMLGKAGFKNPVIEGMDVTADVEEEDDSSVQWPIAQRFEFVTDLVNMIAKNMATSLVITGPGGLGKTHTVKEALLKAGLEDMSGIETEATHKSFKMIKGYSTAKGLYRELFLNKDSVIVFDDCDEVLVDPTALNLLKGALDSYDKRVISWNADMKDEDLPRSFIFHGRVIFISNMQRKQIAGALLTRAYCVDLKMTVAQKIERMRIMTASPTFMPFAQQKHKQEAMELIASLQDRVKELSLRTLQAVTRIRAAGGNWKQLAEYTLTN